MKERTSLRFLTKTAVLLAVLAALQFVTKPLGQLVTGSCVNAVLAISALCVGLPCGLCVAVLSPFLAFLLGIGPAFFPLTPIIAFSNGAYAALLWLLAGRKERAWFSSLLSVIAASAVKFALLYLLVVQGVCRLAALKPAQIQMFTVMFSYPQLLTALIGGVVAILCAKPIQRASRKK